MSNEEFCRAIGQTTSPPANQTGEDQTSQSSQENSLLTKDEKISIFMNLAIPGITTVPRGKVTHLFL